MKILKKLRYYSRLLSAFVRKQQKIILLGIGVGIFVFYLSPKIYSFLPSKNLKKIGLVGRFSPTELPLEVQNLISSGLTQISSDGSAVPSLASSWMTENEGKEYKFALKENLFWQDKTPILAVDINYNFSDVTTTVLDEKTIQFKLKEPFSPFPTIVSKPVFKKGLLGAGAYRLKSALRRGQILEKIVLVPQDSSLPTLVYRFYPTEEAARIAFKLGEIDTIKMISQPAELDDWPEIKITNEVENCRYVAIFFNTQDEHLGDKSLRQALAYAIKKRWGPRAFNSINPDSWAYNPGVKPYNYDLENAKKLLAKSQEEREEESWIKEIELATVPSLLSMAEEIAKDWGSLGVETKVKVISVIPDDFQALLLAQEISPDPDQYTLWHSTQEMTNLSHYKNPKIDKLLEDGRRTLDKEKRKEIYLDFQRFIVEDTPAIFLFHPTLYTIERK